jgi:arginine repressor
MADDKLITIKKIRTTSGEHEIDARYLGGYTFEQIQGMVQGVSGTFVISETKNTIENVLFQKFLRISI